MFKAIVCLAFLTAMASAEELQQSSGLPETSASPEVPEMPEVLEPPVSIGADQEPFPFTDEDRRVNPLLYDKPLLARQYGVGVLSGFVAGAIGFYIGNAFEGAIFGSRSQKGYLSFTGIRYSHRRGPAWGGGSGILLGTTLGTFFTGETDEEQGSILWTVAGASLGTVAAFYLADAAGVQESRGMLPFLPLLFVPSLGAVAGYETSRWINDHRRFRITETTTATVQPPRFGMLPGRDGAELRFDALHLTF